MVAWKQYLKSFASFFELSIAPRFMRKVERVDSESIVNNTFQRTFDKKFIESHLGAKDAPKEIVFKLIVERVDEKHILQAGGREIFHKLDEIKHRYNYLKKTRE